MQNGNLEARVEFYGISPWEVEVAHGYLGSVFKLDEAEVVPPNEDVVSYMRIRLPVVFSDAFFEWFGFKQWEKIKLLLKEMKRRRGKSAGSLVIRLDFEAKPPVSFVIDSNDRTDFDNSVEKLDYVLEVIEHHLVENRPRPLVYRFNIHTRRWGLDDTGSASQDRLKNTRKTI